LAELALNSEGQSWGNLGYWKNDTNYSDACRALAVMLGEAAKLDAQSHIFDAGFGCGDQIELWFDQFKVASVTGINLSESQTDLARERLKDSGSSNKSILIAQGDACDPTAWSELLGKRSVNRVLALDCAYHFSNRKQFFQLAHQHLSSNGTITLTDFVRVEESNNRSWKNWVLNIMFKLSRIPIRNMVTKKDYFAELQLAGFTDYKADDISGDVMPAFNSWQKSLATAQSKNLSKIARVKYRITGRFLDWAYRHKLLQCQVIRAIRKD